MILALLTGCGESGSSEDRNDGDSTTSDVNGEDGTSDTELDDVDLGDEVSDADPDMDESLTGNWTDLEQTEPDPDLDPMGAANIAAQLSAGEVRAGVVKNDDDRAVFDSRGGRCRPGDFKIYNDRVAFCIEGAVASTHIMYDGGRVMDAVPLTDGVPGDDQLLLLGSSLELRGTALTDITVLRDGSDGGPAVIRAAGTDERLRFLLGIIGSDLFSLPPSGQTSSQSTA